MIKKSFLSLPTLYRFLSFQSMKMRIFNSKFNIPHVQSQILRPREKCRSDPFPNGCGVSWLPLLSSKSQSVSWISLMSALMPLSLSVSNAFLFPSAHCLWFVSSLTWAYREEPFSPSVCMVVWLKFSGCWRCEYRLVLLEYIVVVLGPLRKVVVCGTVQLSS